MYAGFGFGAFEIGDVDVVFHEGKFHLFHLVLPNHDYIAHAVSTDGLTLAAGRERPLHLGSGRLG